MRAYYIHVFWEKKPPQKHKQKNPAPKSQTNKATPHKICLPYKHLYMMNLIHLC